MLCQHNSVKNRLRTVVQILSAGMHHAGQRNVLLAKSYHHVCAVQGLSYKLLSAGMHYTGRRIDQTWKSCQKAHVMQDRAL